MKKRYALILVLAVLFTGCSVDTEERISSTEVAVTSTTLTEHTEISTSDIVTTSSAAATNVTATQATASYTLTEQTPVEERGQLITIPSSDVIFSEFDLIMLQQQDGLDMEETITLLMCRNVIAFETGQLYPFEFISRPEVLDFSGDTPLICELSSEYYETSADIEAMYRATYVEEVAQERMQRNGEPWFFDNEDGNICVDLRLNSGTWVTQPFSTSTEIQICSYSDTYCEFVWHYTQPFLDEDDVIRSYPFEMICGAAKENGEWRLVMMVFDNPELSTEGMRELYE